MTLKKLNNVLVRVYDANPHSKFRSCPAWINFEADNNWTDFKGNVTPIKTLESRLLFGALMQVERNIICNLELPEQLSALRADIIKAKLQSLPKYNQLIKEFVRRLRKGKMSLCDILIGSPFTFALHVTQWRLAEMSSAIFRKQIYLNYNLFNLNPRQVINALWSVAFCVWLSAGVSSTKEILHVVQNENKEANFSDGHEERGIKL